MNKKQTSTKPIQVFPLFAIAIAVFAIVFSGTRPIKSDEIPNLTSAAPPPNIVMFFIDDLGYMDLGCYGAKLHQTPNIDALAARSARFTDFYSANPVCSPTRAALMTGKAPQRVGITQWISQPSDIHLPSGEITIGEALSSAGYQTGYIGKWHLGEKDDQQPIARGFSWMRCVNRAGQPGSYFFPFKRKSNPNAPRSFWDVPDLDDREVGDYLNDEMTDHALSFISDNQNAPFFLCFSHYAVHTPIQAPKPLVEKYKRLVDQSPATGPKFLTERNNAKTRIHQDNPTYAAMTENLDTNVGRVLDHLDELSLSANTIIIFTSDNGGLSTLRRLGPASCRPLRAGKGWTYEGGIRVPTLIAWPKKIKPSVTATPGITMDLYPTILELAGLPLRPEQHLDGHSLVSALDGEPDDVLKKRFLAWTYPHNHGSGHTPSNAIRLGDWKLVQLTDSATPADREFELYNLDTDIGERHNVAAEYPKKTRELASLLADWLKSTTPDR